MAKTPVGKPTDEAVGLHGFPIVGIGASAGGVAAFEAFFSTMPADNVPGMAFVLVQHLARDHKSILSELIRRYTKMRVFEVADERFEQRRGRVISSASPTQHAPVLPSLPPLRACHRTTRVRR